MINKFKEVMILEAIVKLIMVYFVQVSTFADIVKKWCYESKLHDVTYAAMPNCWLLPHFNCLDNVPTSCFPVDSLCPDSPGWEVRSKHPFDVIVEVFNSCVRFFQGMLYIMLFVFSLHLLSLPYSLSLKKFSMAL